MTEPLKPLKIKPRSLRDIIKESHLHYLSSKSLRHQWIRKTLKLLNEDKHILYNNREELWKITVLKK